MEHRTKEGNLCEFEVMLRGKGSPPLFGAEMSFEVQYSLEFYDDEGMRFMQSVNILCDLCGSKAEREIEINGQKVAVCSPGCYSRFWVREYDDWRTGQYSLKVEFGNAELASEIERKLEFVTKRSTG